MRRTRKLSIMEGGVCVVLGEAQQGKEDRDGVIFRKNIRGSKRALN